MHLAYRGAGAFFVGRVIMLREFDHIVWAVNDLDAAKTRFQALGFEVSTTAHHPFGTKNALIWLGSTFLELLAIEDESKFPASDASHFSFPQFNQDFLQYRQGASMLAMASDNVERDLAIYRELDLTTYPQFDFERLALLPEGGETKVSFSLGFLRDDAMPETGFFVCQHHNRQVANASGDIAHDNGISALSSVIFAASNPSDHHEFLGGFSGQREMRSTSAGLVIETRSGLVEVLTPSALQVFYGVSPLEAMPAEGGIAALVLEADLNKAIAALKKAQIDYSNQNDQLVIQGKDLFGCALILRAA